MMKLIYVLLLTVFTIFNPGFASPCTDLCEAFAVILSELRECNDNCYSGSPRNIWDILGGDDEDKGKPMKWGNQFQVSD